jgi:hypothetical protein
MVVCCYAECHCATLTHTKTIVITEFFIKFSIVRHLWPEPLGMTSLLRKS